jgi:MFS transporter, DHA1 family, multidrug resistance protein
LRLATRPALTPVRQAYLAVFVLSVSISIQSAVFPPFAQSGGYEVATVGFLVSIFSVFSLVSRLPAGALLSGRVAPMAAIGSTVLLALSTAGYALSHDLAVLTMMRATSGLAYGVIGTLNMAVLMGAIERREQRAAVTGWYLGWLAAGNAVGGFVCGWLADAVGYQATFVISAAVLVLALPLVGGRSPAAVSPAEGAGKRGERPPWQWMFRLPLLVSGLQAFNVNALSQLIWSFYMLYGLEVGLTLSLLGLHRGAYSTTSMVARPLVAKLTRWVSYGSMATWGLVLTAVVTLLVPFFGGFLPLLVLNIVLGGLRAGALVGSMVAAVEYAGEDPRKRGLAAGMYSFASDCANVLTPLIGGLVAERIGLAAMFWAMPLGLISLYLGLLAVSAWQGRRGHGALAS